MPGTVKTGERLWEYFTYYCVYEWQKLEISDSRSLEAELGKLRIP